MDYGTALTLLLRVAPAYRTLVKEREVKEAARSYLMEKYNLSKPRTFYGSSVAWGGTMAKESCGSDWTETAAKLIGLMVSQHSPNEECCVLCGDLALFCSAIEVYGDKDRIVPLHQVLSTLNSTETFRSLMEMSRGRGNSYALKLIQQEFRSALKDGGIALTSEQ